MAKRIVNPRQQKAERALIATEAAVLALLCIAGVALKPRAASAGAARDQAYLQERAAGEAAGANDAEMSQLGAMADRAADRSAEAGPDAFNPFMFCMSRPQAGPIGGIVGQFPEEPDDADLESAKAGREPTRFQLEGIVMGDRPRAVINGQPVQEGDTVGAFTIIEIDPDHIVVSFKGEWFDLKASRPESQERSKPMRSFRAL